MGRRRTGSDWEDPGRTDKLVFVIPVKSFGNFKCVGVLDDLECYYMTWEEVVSDSSASNELAAGATKWKQSSSSSINSSSKKNSK